MKILEISFKNINALKGEHRIDFTAAPFTTHSLFAITGPTGSGKSTILDVISLALFNNIPRLDKVSRNEIEANGAILTRNQHDAFAKVSYQCASGSYQSIWSISTNRNGNLRDHEMELRDLDQNQILDLKKSEVPAKNEELIGLNYEQFIKSVLLAQGEFAQFIQAKKSERGELLEKITGTGIYRKLGQQAFERHKTENLAIKEQLDTIAIRSKSLMQEAEFEKVSLLLHTKEKSIAPLEKEIEHLEKKIALKNNIAKQHTEIKAVERKKTQTQQETIAFNAQKGQRLKKHEQIAPLGDEIRQWQKNVQDQEELAHESHKANQDIAQLVKEQKKNKAEITEFLNNETDENLIPTALADFAKKVDTLQQKRNEKIARHQTVKDFFKVAMSGLDFVLTKDTAQDLSRLEQLEASLRQKSNHLKTDLHGVTIDKPEEETKRLNLEIKLLNESYRHQEKINQAQQNLNDSKEEHAQLLQERSALPKNIEESQQQINLLNLNLKNKQQEQEIQKLKASLADHRTHLKADQPCPLCGALEHPYADDLPQNNDKLQPQIIKIESELQSLSKINMRQRAQLEIIDKNSVKLIKAINDQNTALGKLQMQATYDKEHQLDEERFKLEINTRELLLDTLDHAVKTAQQHSAVLKSLPLLEELTTIVAEGTSIKNELDKLYQGSDIYGDTQKLLNTLTALNGQKDALDKKTQLLQQKSAVINKALNDLETLLKPKMAALSITNIPQAIAGLLSHNDYSTLKKEQESLLTAEASLQAAIETLTKQLTELVEQDTEKETEVLHQELQINKKNLVELRAENEELRRNITNHTDTLRAITALKKEIATREKQIKRWRLLNELIGDATGKKFNDFAQDLSLTQLLKHANLRLAGLSDRYLMDKAKMGEDDGLVAIDKHMGGQRRSVKTLSGGETFIMSLSMALALSDLASRHVEINSLFIDEGFGTLDPETLDQTLDTLERLEAESSKRIGIISHVESLKERIAAQIQLKRNGQGYSTLIIKE